MARTIWFALSCLLGLSVIAGVRAISIGREKPVVWSPGPELDTQAAPKSDRLDEPPAAGDKITVKTVKIATSDSEESIVKIEEPVVKIEARHWRSTYAKQRTRHYRRHRHRG